MTVCRQRRLREEDHIRYINNSNMSLPSISIKANPTTPCSISSVYEPISGTLQQGPCRNQYDRHHNQGQGYKFRGQAGSRDPVRHGLRSHTPKIYDSFEPPIDPNYVHLSTNRSEGQPGYIELIAESSSGYVLPDHALPSSRPDFTRQSSSAPSSFPPPYHAR